MKILFISDFGLNHSPGGAQQSNDLLIKKGIELGHDIKLHNYDSSPMDFYEHFDLIISSNLEYISKNNPEKIDFIFNKQNHIRVEHDSCSYLSSNLRKKLFEHSKKNFFLSSFHVDYFNEFYGNYFDNIEIVYDPIDTSVFYRSDDEKEYDIVYCGSLHPLKGLQNLLDFSKRNRNRKVSIFGWGDPQITQSITDFCNEYKNVEFFGTKSQKEIADILRKCNAIFHSPIVNEPFCRMVAEGLICGCQNVIGRPNKIGSYLEFQNVGYDEFKEKCQNASSIFWNKIQSKHENNCSS
jgi:glycosyltransferase involved in cell wall biosynthesis